MNFTVHVKGFTISVDIDSEPFTIDELCDELSECGNNIIIEFNPADGELWVE